MDPFVISITLNFSNMNFINKPFSYAQTNGTLKTYGGTWGDHDGTLSEYQLFEVLSPSKQQEKEIKEWLSKHVGIEGPSYPFSKDSGDWQIHKYCEVDLNISGEHIYYFDEHEKPVYVMAPYNHSHYLFKLFIRIKDEENAIAFRLAFNSYFNEP